MIMKQQISLTPFFVKVGSNIENAINENPIKKLDWHLMNKNFHIPNSIFLNPISEIEIQKHLNKIKPSSSYVINNLTNTLLKNTYSTISYPLSIIFNNSISSGKYPNSLNCAILPIYKSGNKMIYFNYRPIALSLTISKIFEKCIKTHVMEFLLHNNFFSNNQYAFITGKSTEDAHFAANNKLY